MADTIIVQRGTHYTQGMHIYPGETPTGLWASIEAQNAGLVAGNWQNHLVCMPSYHVVETYNPGGIYVPDVMRLEAWRLRWPKLGSYTMLSFNAKAAEGFPESSPKDFEFIVRIWDAGYVAPFYSGTTTEEFIEYQTKRITIAWNMDESGLDAHIDTNVFVEILGFRSSSPDSLWRIRLNEILLVTANRPLF